MNRFLHPAAFAVGLAAVIWVGAGHVRANPLALAMTLLIGGFYLMGALELHRFRQATRSLAHAVADDAPPPASLDAWLAAVHPSLRQAVRLRVEGERVGLPGPAMTPYLAGLLVLLGMLGTFLGMVVTLNGTGMALESATDLQAIRASLATPVKGLGLAFGTSVAGVAASAMLGLMSAWCRRERAQAAQRLDARIATTLRPFSLAYQREESFRLLQVQARVMPELVDRLQALMATIERQGEASAARLCASQERFHERTGGAFAELAASVERSLKDSLAQSARLAGETIQPVVQATMSGIARETAALQENLAQAVQRQLAEVAGTFEQRSASLVDAVARSHATWQGDIAARVSAAHAGLQAELASREQQRLAAWTGALESTAASLQREWQSSAASLQREWQSTGASLQREWQQAGAQSLGQQQAICATLERTATQLTAQAQAQARDTIAEVARLAQAASEAPRAAAEVIAELRQQLSQSMARDNAVLEERSRLMETLATLLDAVNHASTEQRAAIDALVASSADVLERAGTRFAEAVDGQAATLSGAAAQVTGSAVEVSSLGEAFGLAVQLFADASDKLTAHLQRIEGALGKSIARSDEQLAYYVGQAREIIDLSLVSQKQIVDDLQRLSMRRDAVGAEA